MLITDKLSLEASDSWENYHHQQKGPKSLLENVESWHPTGQETPAHLRHLKKNSNGGKYSDEDVTKSDETSPESRFHTDAAATSNYLYQSLKERRKREKALNEMYRNPGIQDTTMHGMMIDAGSTGSRMHVYEFDRRVLVGEKEIAEAVSGRKLTHPRTNSRWTEELAPGLATFASLNDTELYPALQDYLRPLIDFAIAVLHSKQNEWSRFPIYLKCTAGMRTLDTPNRARVITAVRNIFSNRTYSPFYFIPEQARVISGEEEAIYGWTAVNFALGTLIEASEGSGTVVNPKLTYGALDLGGASTQISFYEANEDIMSNLFKLQIGMGKHWNVYAHSFLYFGINEAWNRLGARLVLSGAKNEYKNTVYNPCLPGGSSVDFTSAIHFDKQGIESWQTLDNGVDLSKSYTATLKNDLPYGDFEKCSDLVRSLLAKDQNNWCNFAHHGDCSVSHVYQPRLPLQQDNFGEFFAFTNFFKVWDFLQLPTRSSLQTLQTATRALCKMNEEQVIMLADGRYKEEDALYMCFRSTYVFELLHTGYGFPLEESITAANVVDGHKIGWALGSMLYEINTLPWVYLPKREYKEIEKIVAQNSTYHIIVTFASCIILLMAIGLISITRHYEKVHHHFQRNLRKADHKNYASVDDVILLDGIKHIIHR